MHSPIAPIILGYEFKTQEDIKEFIKTERDLLHRRFFYAIKHAFMNHKDDATILQAFHLNFSILATKDGWVNSLTKSLRYFESIDEFETCIDVNNLLKMVEAQIRDGVS